MAEGRRQRDAKEIAKIAGNPILIYSYSVIQSPTVTNLHLIKTFRESCPAPVLSLERQGEDRVLADFHASPDDPHQFLRVVDDILAASVHP